MKVRFAGGRVRVRLDDLEVSALQGGQVLKAEVRWPGGGWTLCLEPGQDGIQGSGGQLDIGLRRQLAVLADPAQEGVSLDGPPRVRIEKDFGPQHL